MNDDENIGALNRMYDNKGIVVWHQTHISPDDGCKYYDEHAKNASDMKSKWRWWMFVTLSTWWLKNANKWRRVLNNEQDIDQMMTLIVM